MAFLLAWQQLKSHWQAGELRVLVMALVLAVASVSAVSFFIERVSSALSQQGGLLLGGDMVVTSQHAMPAHYLSKAAKQQLSMVQTMEFPSMVLFGEASQLAEIKALGQGFPLRGDLTINVASGKAKKVNDIPAAGTVWVEPKLANTLQVKIGDTLQVGESHLVIAALIIQEPSRGGDMFSFAPRLMMNMADVQATNLIQYGSRVKYQLLLAGQSQQLKAYESWAKTQLKSGERIEDVTNARPEVKSALEKSHQFLGLSAMVSVILSMVAMFLASIPYVHNSLNHFAIMRCLGASKRLITQVILLEALYLALIGGLLGLLLGFLAQHLLAGLLGDLLLGQLPVISLNSLPLKPLAVGLLLSVSSMLAMLWPHLKSLSDVPAMRVLRNDTLQQHPKAIVQFLPFLLVLIVMVFWQASHINLAIATMLGLSALVLVISLLVWLVLMSLKRLPMGKSSSLKLGLAGLKRRPLLAVAQSVGLSLGVMALVLLAFIRTDLMQNWRKSLPEDAPNRFVINIQPDQIKAIQQFFNTAGIQDTNIYPMIRGRLVEQNGKPFNANQFKDERARRLAEREFNLSVAQEMQADNQLVAGRWWDKAELSQPYVSIEQGLADTLGIHLGDQLTYDIAGIPIKLQVTSIRKVDWDTMRANFFAVTPPQLLQGFNASHITSFYLPPHQEPLLQALMQQHPNLTVIDVAALMQQVRSIMNKMTSAIQWVFMFSLFSGLAVLYAALVATREERIKEATLLRVLGAKKGQVLMAAMTEFATIGLLAVIPAVIAANILAFFISHQVLNIGYSINWLHTASAILIALIAIPMASWIVLKSYLNLPPRSILQST